MATCLEEHDARGRLESLGYGDSGRGRVGWGGTVRRACGDGVQKHRGVTVDSAQKLTQLKTDAQQGEKSDLGHCWQE